MIKTFSPPYNWLSNFYPCNVMLYGLEYITVEHAYQSAKNDSKEWKEFCQKTDSPGKVKKMSKKVDLIDNWEFKRVYIMYDLIDQKFDKEPFKTLLLETGDEYIQEGNLWNDRFWGVDIRTGIGANVLGNLILSKRGRLKNVRSI